MRLPDAISSGSHLHPEDGLCVMETVAYISGETHTDHPQCACPVITEFAIRINDAMPDDTTRTHLLGPLVWRIAGTRGSAALERKRAFMCADWAVRTIMPLTMDAAGLPAEGERLRRLPPIVDETSANAASDAYLASSVAAAYAAKAGASSVAAAAYAAYAANAAVNAAAYAGAGLWENAAAFLARLCDEKGE